MNPVDHEDERDPASAHELHREDPPAESARALEPLLDRSSEDSAASEAAPTSPNTDKTRRCRPCRCPTSKRGRIACGAVTAGCLVLIALFVTWIVQLRSVSASLQSVRVESLCGPAIAVTADIEVCNPSAFPLKLGDITVQLFTVDSDNSIQDSLFSAHPDPLRISGGFGRSSSCSVLTLDLSFIPTNETAVSALINEQIRTNVGGPFASVTPRAAALLVRVDGRATLSGTAIGLSKTWDRTLSLPTGSGSGNVNPNPNPNPNPDPSPTPNPDSGASSSIVQFKCASFDFSRPTEGWINAQFQAGATNDLTVSIPPLSVNLSSAAGDPILTLSVTQAFDLIDSPTLFNVTASVSPTHNKTELGLLARSVLFSDPSSFSVVGDPSCLLGRMLSSSYGLNPPRTPTNSSSGGSSNSSSSSDSALLRAIRTIERYGVGDLASIQLLGSSGSTVSATLVIDFSTNPLPLSGSVQPLSFVVSGRQSSDPIAPLAFITSNAFSFSRTFQRISFGFQIQFPNIPLFSACLAGPALSGIIGNGSYIFAPTTSPAFSSVTVDAVVSADPSKSFLSHIAAALADPLHFSSTDALQQGLFSADILDRWVRKGLTLSPGTHPMSAILSRVQDFPAAFFSTKVPQLSLPTLSLTVSTTQMLLQYSISLKNIDAFSLRLSQTGTLIGDQALSVVLSSYLSGRSTLTSSFVTIQLTNLEIPLLLPSALAWNSPDAFIITHAPPPSDPTDSLHRFSGPPTVCMCAPAIPSSSTPLNCSNATLAQHQVSLLAVQITLRNPLDFDVSVSSISLSLSAPSSPLTINATQLTATSVPLPSASWVDIAVPLDKLSDTEAIAVCSLLQPSSRAPATVSACSCAGPNSTVAVLPAHSIRMVLSAGTFFSVPVTLYP